MRSLTAILLFSTLLMTSLTPAVHADELKLKSGEVLTNVKVIKDYDDRLIVKLLSGKRRTIKKADIAEHIKKPTLGDIFTERLDKIGKKDTEGMMELAKWGLDNGVKKDAIKLLNKVLRKDRKNEKVRHLLGHKKVNGKWLSGSALKRAVAKALAAEMKAKGWLLDKKTGEYVDPYTAKCRAAGLIKHDGVWRTEKAVRELKKGNLFLEGVWYTPEEKKKYDQDMRRVGDEWKELSDLNRQHRSPADPWILEGDHFVIIGTVNHDALTSALKQMEEIWEPLVNFFGDAPLTAKIEDKPKVMVMKNLESYKLSGSKTQGQREAAYSSNCGFFYSKESGKTITYYHDESHLREWCRAGAAHAFMAAIVDVERLKSPMLDAIGSYFGSHMSGKYYPQWSIFWYLKTVSFQSPRKAFADFKYEDREGGFAGIGYAIHFLIEEYPAQVRAWIPQFLRRGASFGTLLDAIEKEAGNDLKKDLREAHSAYKKAYKQVLEG